jgi:hypothetical protein
VRATKTSARHFAQRGGYNYLAAASALLSRALRRFAAFSWMIPRLAALSIAETRARICSGLAVCEEPAVFCIVRRRVTTLRFRSDRFIVWRARLAADLVLAIVNQKLVDVHARERVAIVNSEDFPDPEHAPTHKWRSPVQGLRATSVCSTQASLFAAGQQVPHAFAFGRPRV